MPELEKLADIFLSSYDLSSITRALFAASFFFELHCKPISRGGSYVCHGTIRCRSPDTRALIRRVLAEYPNASFITEDGISLGDINEQGLCVTCGLYYKAVNFKVCHCDQTTSISLRFNKLSLHKISGFPQSMSHFASRQIMDAEFGRPDHLIQADLDGCKCPARRKRRRPPASTTKTNKRQCRRLV